MTVNDASLGESGSKLSKVAATSLLMGVTRGSSEAYVFRAPGISPSGAPRCGTALRSSRATNEDEADHGDWSNILCYPNSPNMHAREKEQIRDWLFKGPKERAARLIPMDFHWNFPNSPFGTGGRGPTDGCCFVFSFRLPWLM